MIQTIKKIWRVMRKTLAVIVFLFAFIQSGGFIQGLNYLLDGGEFVDVGGVMVISGLIATALIVVGMVVWPGKRKLEVDKSGPPRSSTSSRHPKKITPQMSNDELSQDDALLMAVKNGDLYGDGVDADEIPGTVGAFGLDVNNPIPVKSVLGAIEYLENLTFPDGTKVRYKRVGSMTSSQVKHPVDAYELARESGDAVCTIFLSPYHKRNSRKKPDFSVLEDESSSTDDATFTSPFEPIVEVQSVDGVRQYCDRLSKFSYPDICIELSNVMSAKHNLMSIQTPLSEFAEKQTRVTDLTDKALWICIRVFGQDAVTNINKNNPSQLNELINELDQEVAQKDLEPEKHGATLLSKLGEMLEPDKGEPGDHVSEPNRYGASSVRFGALPNCEVETFQRARDVVFKRDIASEEERKRLLEAREVLTRLYLHGYGEAYSVLGYMAVVHAGTKSDIDDGLKILQNCSDAGDWGSSCLLGDIYHLGLSVRHDYARAWQYYTKAVDQGSVAALTSKGIMAIHGRGVPKSIELGRELLTRAHERGATTAKHWLDQLDSEDFTKDFDDEIPF